MDRHKQIRYIYQLLSTKEARKTQLNVRSLRAFNIESSIQILCVLMCACAWYHLCTHAQYENCIEYLTVENVLNACFTFNQTVYRAFNRNDGKFSECIIFQTKRNIIKTNTQPPDITNVCDLLAYKLYESFYRLNALKLFSAQQQQQK